MEAIFHGGTIFKMSSEGDEIQRALEPSIPIVDGAVPCGGLIEGANGKVYGTTPPRRQISRLGHCVRDEHRRLGISDRETL